MKIKKMVVVFVYFDILKLNQYNDLQHKDL